MGEIRVARFDGITPELEHRERDEGNRLDEMILLE